MRTIRALIRVFLPTLLLTLALGLVTATASAAPPDGAKATLFPGAKLMHKFAKEVYRLPVLVTTEKGPLVAIWLDEFDPNPPSRIPGIPAPDPRVDLHIWDPMTNKDLHKLAYPKDPIALSPAMQDMAWVGWMAVSPDGKRLATRTVDYNPHPGSAYGDFDTKIRLIDLGSEKVQLVSEYKEEKAPGASTVFLHFAPDGSLVTVHDTTCTIREPDKDKPRSKFEVTRSAERKLKEYFFRIQDVAVSPDGSQVAIAADGTIMVYDAKTGKKLFQAARAAPETKKNGDLVTGTVSLAYAPSGSEPTLLAAEAMFGSAGGLGAPPAGKKDLILVRQFNLKDMKEISKQTINGYHYSVSAYYTAQGEPRVLYNGKIVDGATGKELHKFDAGAGAAISRDGKVLIRTTKKKKDDRTMTVEVWSLDNEK